MLAARTRFADNLTRARDLRALVINLKAGTAGALDLSDILRAAIVGAVSSFDAFIHELTRIGMVECFQNVRPRTDAFGRFAVSMDGVLLSMGPGANVQWLVDEVRRQHGWLAFQHPDKVADAVRLFCGKKLWEEVGNHLGIDAKSAKTRLALIIDRRNKIAHEADMDPSSPGSRWPIDEVIVQDAIDTLEQIGLAIYHAVTTP